MEDRILIYDTTLRDGTQGEDINFSLHGKIRIAKELDRLGVQFIEGGWIPSNPKDDSFFQKISTPELENSSIIACGSTRRPGREAEEDSSLKALVESGVDGVALVGKSWKLHVRQVLNTELEENLDMIEESVRMAKRNQKLVIYDAEHFFDGYRDDPDYALETLKRAQSAGADYICLCDTNGGTLPEELRSAVSSIKSEVKAPLGIHAHNDSGLAVANSLAAVKGGAKMVQGTINGYGERVGNANLSTLIPDLSLKLQKRTLEGGREQLKDLTTVSHAVSELANKAPNRKAPYVGADAFAHKAGMHVDAVVKNPETFEHIRPKVVGNERRFLASELSGKSTIKRKLLKLGFDVQNDDKLVQKVLERLKELENEGHQFENADASLKLLAWRVQDALPDYFEILDYGSEVAHRAGDRPRAEAEVTIRVKDQTRGASAAGDGPVHALDNAFRFALNSFYPPIKEMKLTDYKVRILESHRGTAAKPRVVIEMTNGSSIWTTVGVSTNIIEASWNALRDAYIYGLQLYGTPAHRSPAEKLDS